MHNNSYQSHSWKKIYLDNIIQNDFAPWKQLMLKFPAKFVKTIMRDKSTLREYELPCSNVIHIHPKSKWDFSVKNEWHLLPLYLWQMKSADQREIQSKATEDSSKVKKGVSYSVRLAEQLSACVADGNQLSPAASQVLKCETLTCPKWRKRANGAKTFCQPPPPPPLWPYISGGAQKSETEQPFSGRAYIERKRTAPGFFARHTFQDAAQKVALLWEQTLNWFHDAHSIQWAPQEQTHAG
jgi:hypothetical protein